MSDQQRRRRERDAQRDPGDKASAQAMTRENERHDHVPYCIFYGGQPELPIGDYLYLECGPNYAECGKLVDVRMSEFGCALAVLDDCRRKDDENPSPTWLTGPSDGVVLPSTAVTYCQMAKKRWPTFDR